MAGTSVDHVGRRGAQGAVQPNLLAAPAFRETGPQQQSTELGLGGVDGDGATARKSRVRLTGRNVVLPRQVAPPLVEALDCVSAVEEAVVVGVAEGLEAVGARRFAQGGALADDLPGRRDHVSKAVADPLQEAGAAGHRVPEQGVHGVLVHLADDQDLQVVDVHVEHAGRAEAQGFQDAVRCSRAVARRQGKGVRDHVRMEAHVSRLAVAPLFVALVELLPLAVRRERRDAVAADRAHRIAQRAPAFHGGRGTYVDQTHPHAPAKEQRLRAPPIGIAAAVLVALDARDGDAQLKAKVLFVGDVGGVHEIDVADGHGGQRCVPVGAAAVRGLGNGPPLPRHRIGRHVGPALVGVPVKAAGGEAMAVGVDQVAGHVLAQRGGRRTRKPELRRPRLPEGHFGPACHGAGLQAVSGQEPLRGEHTEGVGVVVSLRMSPVSRRHALEPLDKPVAASAERLLGRLQASLQFLFAVQAPDLPHRPLQAVPQARHDLFELVGESLHMALQRRVGYDCCVRFGPPLTEHALRVVRQAVRKVLHQAPQGAEVEGRIPHRSVGEQVGRHSPGQGRVQHVANAVLLGLGPFRVLAVSVEGADHDGVNVLGDHHLVAKVERRRVDLAAEQLRRVSEVGAVVGDGPAVGHVHGHAVTSSRPSGALPVVGGQGRHVAHEHRVQPTDVDSQLQRRRAHEAVHGLRLPLESVLQPVPLVGRHHGGVLLGAKHRVVAVQQLQVVVVGVFLDPLQRAVAPPGRAQAVGHVAGGLAPALPATPHAPVRLQQQLVGGHLKHPAHSRQRSLPGPLEDDPDKQPRLDQVLEQALQKRLDCVARHAPLPGDLAHGGIAAAGAQPLGDLRGLLRGLPAQLRGVGLEEAGKVALLNFPVAVHPVFGEDLVHGVEEGALAAQIVQDAGDAFAQLVGRDAQLVGVAANPRVRRAQAVVLHLHPAPRLQAVRLARGKGDLAQHLHAQVLPALLHVTDSGAVARGGLPDFRDQRPREGPVLVQSVVQAGRKVADGHRVGLQRLAHQCAEAEAACVVLHPAGLERGVLPVVAEDEKASPLGVLHHVLREHVHVGHVDGAHLAGRFPVSAAAGTATHRSARQAAREEARVVLLLPNRQQLQERSRTAACRAACLCPGVSRAAAAAEGQGRRALVGRRGVVRFVRADEPVGDQDSLSARLLV